LNQWIKMVAFHMPQLNKAQAVVLALWSFGMVVAQSSGLTSVTRVIADLTEQKEANVRQRLREWNRNRADKTGQKRQELDVKQCFVPLLCWVLSWWPPEEKRLVLAMDASTLGDRFVVLAISVVYRACAIPIAWKIYAVDDQKGWKHEWLRLFGLFKQVVPPDWTVLVTADRGLYANWLFDAIKDLGWHPFLRINTNGKYCLPGSSQFLPVRQLVTGIGCDWAGQVTCFKGKPVRGSLLIRWLEGYKDPWVILTDLPVEHANIAWYGLRAWIECGFRQTKRAGWHWNQTRMIDPERAARHWLAMATATLWVVSVGGECDAACSASTLESWPSFLPKSPPKHRPRLLSCFRQGLLRILVALIAQRPLPFGHFACPYDLPP
jgi:hypothetical protein